MKIFLRILGLGVTVLQILVSVIITLSIFTLASSFLATILAGTQAFTIEQTQTDYGVTINAKNAGVFPIQGITKLKFFEPETKELIFELTDSKEIAPNTGEKLIVSVPLTKIAPYLTTYSAEQLQSAFETSLEYKTLFNLVGIGISININKEEGAKGSDAK